MKDVEDKADVSNYPETSENVWGCLDMALSEYPLILLSITYNN